MTFFNTLYILNDEISSFSFFRFGPATPVTHTTIVCVFHCNGKYFINKRNPVDQAKALKGLLWRRKREGLFKGYIWKGKKAGHGWKLSGFCVAISLGIGVCFCNITRT